MTRGPDSYIENLTDEDYAAVAREALRGKDLRLAMEQVSAALALHPLHRPHLQRITVRPRPTSTILTSLGSPYMSG